MPSLPNAAIVYGEWYLYERKRIEIHILGENVDLSNTELRFLLRSEPDGSTLLTKQGGSVSVNSGDIVRVDIGGTNDAELQADYAQLVANYKLGVFWFELYDRDTPLKIAEGYATIGQALFVGD